MDFHPFSVLMITVLVTVQCVIIHNHIDSTRDRIIAEINKKKEEE